MRWKVTIEGMDEFGGRDIAEMAIKREFSQLANGEIGLAQSPARTPTSRRHFASIIAPSKTQVSRVASASFHLCANGGIRNLRRRFRPPKRNIR
jgi:hypothetical protein